MSPRMAALARLAAASLAAALLVAACGDDDPTALDDASATTAEVTTTSAEPETTSEPTTTTAPAPAVPPGAEGADQVIEVEIAGGQVTGGGRHPVELGSTVALVVTADAADEVHVHGYDLYADLVPGEPAVIAFTADIPGVFEAELHDAGIPLVELEIS